MTDDASSQWRNQWLQWHQHCAWLGVAVGILRRTTFEYTLLASGKTAFGSCHLPWGNTETCCKFQLGCFNTRNSMSASRKPLESQSLQCYQCHEAILVAVYILWHNKHKFWGIKKALGGCEAFGSCQCHNACSWHPLTQAMQRTCLHHWYHSLHSLEEKKSTW